MRLPLGGATRKFRRLCSIPMLRPGVCCFLWAFAWPPACESRGRVRRDDALARAGAVEAWACCPVCTLAAARCAELRLSRVCDRAAVQGSSGHQVPGTRQASL